MDLNVKMKLYKIRYVKDKSIECSEYYKEFSERVKEGVYRFISEPKCIGLKNGDQIVSLDINHSLEKVFEQFDPYIGIWYNNFGHTYTIFIEEKSMLDAVECMVEVFTNVEI